VISPLARNTLSSSSKIRTQKHIHIFSQESKNLASLTLIPSNPRNRNKRAKETSPQNTLIFDKNKKAELPYFSRREPSLPYHKHLLQRLPSEATKATRSEIEPIFGFPVSFVGSHLSEVQLSRVPPFTA